MQMTEQMLIEELQADPRKLLLN